VAQSLFPDIAPDRPVGPLFGSVQSGTNAELIRTVAPLYLSGRVLDVTYGRGKWWDLHRPEDFTCHDLRLDGVDFRDLPHPDGSFDAVCFDPPYIPAGGARTTGRTGDESDFSERYGVGLDQEHAPRNSAQLKQLIHAGMAECSRVLRRGGFLLAKGTDYVTGGRFRLGHLDYLLPAEQLGLRIHDLIVHHTGSGPGGHNITTQLRARRHHSYLLVFERVADRSPP
jgi:tRNA G10  N-methylase Trm11